MQKLVLSELSDNIITPGQGTTNTVFFAEAQWNTAAGAAIAYRVIILPAFYDGVDKTPFMALP